MAEHGNRALARWRRWAVANLGSFSALFTNTNFGSAWLILAPVVSLVATYAPRRLFLTYFNLFLRRRARRLLNAVDPYVTIDISEPGGEVRTSGETGCTPGSQPPSVSVLESGVPNRD